MRLLLVGSAAMYSFQNSTGTAASLRQSAAAFIAVLPQPIEAVGVAGADLPKRSPDRLQQHKRDCAATPAHTGYCTSSQQGSATARHSPMIRSTTSPRSASKAPPVERRSAKPGELNAYESRRGCGAAMAGKSSE